MRDFFSSLSHAWRHPLNRRRRFSGVGRFLKWRTIGILLPGKAVVEWVNGSRLMAGWDEFGLSGNLYCGLQEFEDMAFLLHFLRTEDLFVDVGANGGAYTILAASGIGSKTVAVEPVPSTFLRLSDSVALNHVEDRVTRYNVGASDAEGELRFSSRADCMNHVLTDSEKEDDPIRVPVRRLDALLEGLSPALMKIDVEGYEIPVLRGASETLDRSSLKAVIVEVNGSGRAYGFSDEDLCGLLSKAGFSAQAYDPFTRRLSPLKVPRGNNRIFVRDVGTVQERLQSAPPFSIRDQSL